jgi:hypothetical protein
MHADFPAAGAEYETLGAHKIADVQRLNSPNDSSPRSSDAHIELDPALPILQVCKKGLTHVPLRHHAAGHRHAAVFELLKTPVNIGKTMRYGKIW